MNLPTYNIYQRNMLYIFVLLCILYIFGVLCIVWKKAKPKHRKESQELYLVVYLPILRKIYYVPLAIRIKRAFVPLLEYLHITGYACISALGVQVLIYGEKQYIALRRKEINKFATNEINNPQHNYDVDFGAAGMCAYVDSVRIGDMKGSAEYSAIEEVREELGIEINAGELKELFILNPIADGTKCIIYVYCIHRDLKKINDNLHNSDIFNGAFYVDIAKWNYNTKSDTKKIINRLVHY